MSIGRIAFVCLLLLAATTAIADSYDPLATADRSTIRVVDRVVHDDGRNRDIPLRLYLPPQTSPAPVILFSHGLGGSRENNPYLGYHWAGRGCVVVFLQHPGSDVSVWQDLPPEDRYRALKKAASYRNFMRRVGDVDAVLDALASFDATPSDLLAGRLDLAHVGMSGHSFGAVTTQAVSGQRFRHGRTSLADPRIRAALMMSPSLPKRGGNPSQAFGQVSIPWLLMTGTEDRAMIGDQTAASRQQVFPALPPGNKYELVLYKAEHSAFGDRPLPGDREPRNPNHHRVVLAISSAFWDAYLKGDAAAKAWLAGGGPASVLEPQDRWLTK